MVIYNEGLLSEDTTDETGKNCHYQFNTGYGDILYDYSGNNNHGIIYGAEWITNNNINTLSISDGNLIQKGQLSQIPLYLNTDNGHALKTKSHALAVIEFISCNSESSPVINIFFLQSILLIKKKFINLK